MLSSLSYDGMHQLSGFPIGQALFHWEIYDLQESILKDCKHYGQDITKSINSQVILSQNANPNSSKL